MKGRILLTNQLFSSTYITEPSERVVVSDHMWLTDEKPFNKTTLIHRFVSAKLYANQNHYTRFWVGDKEKEKGGPFTRACRYLKKKGVTEILLFDPIDKPLIQSITSICKKESLTLTIEDTPAFLETHADLDQFLKENPPKKSGGIRSYSHNPFYKWQRKRLSLLMNPDGTFVGGKLTFDTDNREPFPKNITKDPTIVKPLPLPTKSRGDIHQIISFVGKRYRHNPGTLPREGGGSGSGSGSGVIGNAGLYPLTNSQALRRLKMFLKKMLPDFGPYEDAIHPNITYGFHSVLSSSLNNGLLTPDTILKEIKKIKTGKGRELASIEGFIRQVFGWRSYCRLVYREERDTMMRSNYLKHTTRLPKSWFRNEDITTKIPWLDTMFQEAYDKAYAHHIIRLMVFSQWFLLMRIHPRDVLDWFWSVVSIDAYEWVMVPNVLGMGQYADGGIMMTRPYVSSASYLEKMSRNTLKGNVILGKTTVDWREVWKAMYYDFLIHQKSKIGKMYAYSSSYARLRNVKDSQIKEWKQLSKKYRKL